MIEPGWCADAQQFEQRGLALEFRRQLRRRLRIIARPKAVALRAPDIGLVVIADVKGDARVDTLLGQVFCEKRLALAAAVVAGGIEEVPCQPGAAIAPSDRSPSRYRR
jgi:hypothetical protein